jgi:hypothetical protein
MEFSMLARKNEEECGPPSSYDGELDAAKPLMTTYDLGRQMHRGSRRLNHLQLSLLSPAASLFREELES